MFESEFTSTRTKGGVPPVWCNALFRDVAVSVGCLALSFVLNFFAGNFATKRAGNSVADLLLDNLPVLDVDLVFIEGSLLLWFFVGALVIARPERIPFVFKAMALFILIRSGFIVLTHLGPFPNQSQLDSNSIIRVFTFGGDLFFSGHTGSSFLMALIFWRYARLRYLFVSYSALFAAAVLLGHLHYSIDVFAAFFISYGIFDLAKFLFSREYELFERARTWIDRPKVATVSEVAPNFYLAAAHMPGRPDRLHLTRNQRLEIDPIDVPK